jgi:hypothetical protein
MLNGSSCSTFKTWKTPSFPHSFKTISARQITYGAISILTAEIKGLFELLITDTLKGVYSRYVESHKLAKCYVPGKVHILHPRYRPGCGPEGVDV